MPGTQCAVRRLAASTAALVTAPSLLAGCGSTPGSAPSTVVNAASFRAVSIRAVVLNPKLHDVTNTFSSPATIASLAKLLNGLSPAVDSPESCPAEFVSYQITFEPRTARYAAVVVNTDGCDGATVTSAGTPRQVLNDPGNAVAGTAARMLGISTG